MAKERRGTFADDDAGRLQAGMTIGIEKGVRTAAGRVEIEDALSTAGTERACRRCRSHARSARRQSGFSGPSGDLRLLHGGQLPDLPVEQARSAGGVYNEEIAGSSSSRGIPSTHESDGHQVPLPQRAQNEREGVPGGEAREVPQVRRVGPHSARDSGQRQRRRLIGRYRGTNFCTFSRGCRVCRAVHHSHYLCCADGSSCFTCWGSCNSDRSTMTPGYQPAGPR
jgi:hypothetical protein